MLELTPIVTAHDPLALDVRMLASWKGAAVAELLVRDRFGLEIRRVEARGASADVSLQKVPRGRFPLFVSALDGKGGEVFPPSGPVFPAPAETAPDGYPLPLSAVDRENDPMVLKWLGERAVSAARLKGAEEALAAAMSRVDGMGRRLLWAPAGAAACALAGYVIFSLAPQGPGWWAPAALALVLTALSLPAVLRQRAAGSAVAEAAKEAAEARSSWASVNGKLASVGVPSEGAAGGCGC
jgi:hypothetical protein